MNVPFLDLKNFKLSNADYADVQHLNVQGSKKISMFLDGIIKDGLLEMENIQDSIKVRMAGLK